jgi:hypothetical protein
VDGFHHVEDDTRSARQVTQPECPVDLVVFRADRAYGEMNPVDGQGESAPTMIIRFATDDFTCFRINPAI